MKKIQFLGAVVATVYVLVFSCSLTINAQQDRCADILQNGTLKYERFINNKYFKQITYSRFVRSSESDEGDSSGGEVKIPVKKVVLGGKYHREEYRKTKELLDQLKFTMIDSKNEVDTLVTSGDPEIIGAWKSCMTTKGGLALSFEPKNNTEVLVNIEWFPTATIVETEIERDTYLGDVTVKDGMDCFQKGKKIIATKPCRALISLPSAQKDLTLIVNAMHGTTASYLPPRMTIVTETRPLSATAQGAARQEAKTIPKKIALNPNQINDGWLLSFGTISLGPIQVLSDPSRGGNKCYGSRYTYTPYSLSFQFSIDAKKNGSPKYYEIKCSLEASITRVRYAWTEVFPIF